MLTRLKVDGFKNLSGVDISFGPFTCIAGANAVGKSNLFDAIVFLSDLTEKSFYEAAISIRGDGNSGDSNYIKSLFSRRNDETFHTMRFEAELIIPAKGIDSFRQPLEASITFLRYIVELKLRDNHQGPAGPMALVEESLTHITRTSARQHLPFAAGKSNWIETAVIGKRSGGAFISTKNTGGKHVIKLHQDKRAGRTSDINASEAPRTVLSATNFETPTALLARQEMRSWRRLQLESSAMRLPDNRNAPDEMSANGAHLAKALFSLAGHSDNVAEDDEVPTVYSTLSMRLSELVDDVHDVTVDVDSQRDLLTLMVAAEGEQHLPARSLSDGTLRFLALGILELSSVAQVLCLEEPENGIHPTRIGAMLRLLHDIAMDLDEPVGPDNPLRQVIINTHSPGVVEKLDPDELVVADVITASGGHDHQKRKRARFSPIGNTWRSRAHPDARPITLTSLVDYLTYSDRDSGSVSSEPTVKQLIESQLKLELD